MSLIPYIEIVIGTCIWGFSFLAIPWVFESMGPMWLTCIRFLICFLAIDLFFRSLGRPLQYSRKDFFTTFSPGLLLTLYLVLQAAGLRYTTPSKSAFITVLYIVFLPFFEWLFLKRKPKPIFALWIVLALLGSALICNLKIEEFTFGDLLTLLCAVVCAAHILNINRVLKYVPSPIHFHWYQSVWAFLIGLVIAPFFEGFSFLSSSWNSKSLLSLLFLGLGSSVFAFFFQIRAQKRIPPTTLGLLLLLESPWAMLFSFLILREELSFYQLLGSGFILTAALGGHTEFFT